MTNRRVVIAGNWKMNTSKNEGISLIRNILSNAIPTEVDIILCPPFIHLDTAHTLLKGSTVSLGAQTVSEHDSGAFTGEISAQMLTSYAVSYVIIGHSERRSLFHETNVIVNAKLKQCLKNNLNPIFCVGESLEERETNRTNAVISKQLKEGLEGTTEKELETSDFIVAYEPVWAIGTGKSATPAQAQDVHAHIRQELASLLGKNIAVKTRIQYGGSVKAENSKELLSQPDIDGALVGGACLKADSFLGIINESLIIHA